MKLVFLICKKEFKSYFTSPIAYLLMAFFGLIFGFALYTATRDVVRMGFHDFRDRCKRANQPQS
jgi:ABC-type transport system involved in multi-copper enzyme maturation permease subunit